MEENTNAELAIMTLIAHSGDGRSLAFQALMEAKSGNFDEANDLLKKSDEAIKLAHNGQSELLFSEANGNKQEIGLLMIHAQDHFMTSMLANELIKEIIELYQNK